MRYKYPRTPHLPWSPGATQDDITANNVTQFIDKQVVITEKMDGENTTIYQDYVHARSIDSRFHPSRTWVKALQSQVGYRIPEGWRICGENVYAQHSIAYADLPAYFIGFSVWNEHNHCLSWEETKSFLLDLEIPTPKEIFVGIWNKELVEKISLNTDETEGYVVRTVDGFEFNQFANCVAKWVRKGHVQTEKHWMHSEVVPNGLSCDTNTKGRNNE